MEIINSEEIKVGDYISVTLKEHIKSYHWYKTYGKIIGIDEGSVFVHLWVDFNKKEFIGIDKQQFTLSTTDIDHIYERYTEKEFYEKVGKYIIIGQM